MKYSAAIVSLSLLFSACSADEPVINNTDTGWTIVAATSEQPSQIAVIHEPDNIVKMTDAFASANGEALSGIVRKVVTFDTALYVLLPEQRRIEVMSRYSYKRLATIQTSPHQVSDLCFANATTAYTANEDSTVSIIDVTVYKLLSGRDIHVSSIPVAIAALGNQVGACCQSANTLDIIDTPTNTLVSSVPIPQAPTYIGSDKVNGTFVVACLGAGKVNSTDVMTPAHVVSYSTVTKSVVGDIVLSHGGLNPEEVLPRCLLVLDGGFCYLGLNTLLTLVDTKTNQILGTPTVGSFSSFATNLRRNEAVFFDRTNPAQSAYSVVSLSNSSIKSTAVLPVSVVSAYTP